MQRLSYDRMSEALRNHDHERNQLEVAQWAVANASRLAKLESGSSGLSITVKGERITGLVREDVEKSAAYQDLKTNGCLKTSKSEEIEPDLNMEVVESSFLPIKEILKDSIVSRYESEVGISPIDLMDLNIDSLMPDVETFSGLVGRYPEYDYESDLDVWECALLVDYAHIIDVLLSPLHSRGLDAADFAVRNSAAIRSIIVRTEAQTLYGKRNTQEIDAALQKFCRQRAPGMTLYASVIRLLSESHPASTAENETGLEFEKRCAEILREQGYDVQITQASGDKGVDLIVETADYRIAVQCKLLSKPAGVKAVQEVATGARHYKTDYALVICDAGFTSAAEELAQSSGVILGNTKTLKRLEDIF